MKHRDNPSCPVCHSHAQQWRFMGDRVYSVTEFQAQYWNCQACDLKFIHPVPDRNLVASFYPSGYWQEQEVVSFMSRLERFYSRTLLKMDLLKWIRHATASDSVDKSYLDIGCSRGDLLAEVRALGFHVSGIESDARAIDYASSVYGLELLQCDVEEWVPNRTYSVISAFHALEHLRDPCAFLAKIHHALEPDGRLVLRVPNVASLQASMMGKHWKGLEVPRHLYHYSPKSLARLLSVSGFQILDWSTWSLRDGPPALTSSLCQQGEPTWQLIHKRPSLFWKLAYLKCNTLLTPLEWFAAIFGKGGMITMIARRDV